MSTAIPPVPNPSAIPPHYQREADYRRAQQLAKSMLDSGLISLSQFNKLCKLNKESFSPIIAVLSPDYVDYTTNQR